MSTVQHPNVGYPAHRAIMVIPHKPLPRCCGHCYHWRPVGEPSQSAPGECRKRAPEMRPLDRFPETNASEACGEFHQNFTGDEFDAIMIAQRGDSRG